MKIHGLTPQQYRVAQEIAKGCSDKQISKVLHIQQRSVSFHIRRIAKCWELSGNVRVEIANRLNGIAA